MGATTAPKLFEIDDGDAAVCFSAGTRKRSIADAFVYLHVSLRAVIRSTLYLSGLRRTIKCRCTSWDIRPSIQCGDNDTAGGERVSRHLPSPPLLLSRRTVP